MLNLHELTHAAWFNSRRKHTLKPIVS